MTDPGWSFAARQVAGEVEVMATAHPSGAAFLLVYDAGGRVRRAAFLSPPAAARAPQPMPPGKVPAAVMAGAGAERGALLGGW